MKNLFLFIIIATVSFSFFSMSCMGQIYTRLVERFPGKFEYIRFEKGVETKRFDVQKGDMLYDNLFNWISTNTDGWKKDFTTYAPQHLYFSNIMTVNIIDGLVIVNFNIKKGRWIQIIREIRGKRGQGKRGQTSTLESN